MDKIVLDSYEMQFRIAVNIGLHSLMSRGKLGSNIIHDAYKRYCYGIADEEIFLHLDKRLCAFFKADNVEEFKFLYFGRDYPKSNLFVFDWKRDDIVSILDSSKECLLEPVVKGF